VNLEVLVGDLLDSDAEAIVNAANSELWMGGGVAGAIKRAAGNEVESEAMAQGPIKPGESVVTSAGRLEAPIRWVVHAATMGPDLQTSEDYIRLATGSALAAAAGVGARSIALPLLGTGVGGFQVHRAARVMVDAARSAPQDSSIERVVFVVRNEAARRAFEEVL
jgi:O-acetyl-ADP-ribose deacetylase (regulator of RNase III)